jgi:signal transduction histidine kinase
MKNGSSPSLEFSKLVVLYDSKIIIYLGSLIVALVFAYTFKGTVSNSELIIWLIIHTSYLILRCGLTFYFKKNQSLARENPERFKHYYMIVSIYGGLGWGIASLYFLEGQSADKLLLVTTILSGTVAASLATNAASLRASLAFSYSLLLPFTLAVLNSNVEFKFVLIALLLLFIFIITSCAKYIYDTLAIAIEYRLSSDKLLKDLESSKELREIAQNQALASTKMASIGELASGFAHEINNPLTIVNGNLVILKKKMADDDISNKAFDRCFENISRISGLIDSLKNVSRGEDTNESDSNESMKVSDVIENATRLMNEKLKIHNIDFDVEITNSFAEIDNGHKAVTQLLLNLITNTYRLINNSPSPWIKIKSFQGAGFIQIEICSSDTGLSPDMVNRFLDPFYIPNNNDPEFGTILSLSQTQAHKYGHELEYKQLKNHSCFVLKLAV